jgi:hypothetical protein
MERSGNKKEADRIHPDMTVLDVVSSYRQSEAVFKKYDERAGVCICCEALFVPLKDVSKRYGLNLSDLIEDLRRAAGMGGK